MTWHSHTLPWTFTAPIAHTLTNQHDRYSCSCLAAAAHESESWFILPSMSLLEQPRPAQTEGLIRRDRLEQLEVVEEVGDTRTT